MAYVFNHAETRDMTAAGVDVIVTHLGTTVGGNIGADPANTPSLDDAVDRTEEMIAVARAENPDVIVLTHGGPIATPEDVRVVLARTSAQGFVRASTMERLPVESAIRDTVQAFKSPIAWGQRRSFRRAVTTVVLVGTLDTKGREYARLRDLVAALGAEARIVDVGIQPLDAATVAADVDAESVVRRAGFELATLRAAADRGAAIQAMAAGAAAAVAELHAGGRLDAIAAIGGSGGTAIATAAMRALPFGVPKLMVSTVASGDMSPYVQGSDITMSHPVVDVVGDNAIVESVLRSAAGAIVGMATAAAAPMLRSGCPTVAATMFGVTTPCVTLAREELEQRGYEVLTFHATGIGGDAMERLIEAEYFDAVLDVTTTELADELVGGIHPAGAQRLRTAGRLGIPQVVSVGALDMVNFGPRDTVPRRLGDRTIVQHNPQVTLVRTTAEECAELGARLAKRVRDSSGPVSVYLPLRGTSMLAVAGQPFHDPIADEALFDAIRDGCGSAVEIVELDCDINDPMFARSMADRIAA